MSLDRERGRAYFLQADVTMARDRTATGAIRGPVRKTGHGRRSVKEPAVRPRVRKPGSRSRPRAGAVPAGPGQRARDPRERALASERRGPRNRGPEEFGAFRRDGYSGSLFPFGGGCRVAEPAGIRVGVTGPR